LASRTALTHSGATAVIMGHTHESQDHPDGLSYVNTGSWTRYLQASAGNDPSSWSLLRRNAAANFPYRLLFAQIDVARPQAVELNTWRTSMPFSPLEYRRYLGLKSRMATRGTSSRGSRASMRRLRLTTSMKTWFKKMRPRFDKSWMRSSTY
jgi:hypothetical protein